MRMIYGVQWIWPDFAILCYDGHVIVHVGNGYCIDLEKIAR